jgi:prophage antirepressor-like protein
MNSKKSDNKFFLDVFNNLLNFENSNVIVIFDLDGNIWFKLRDLFKMLNYDAKKAKNRFEININYKQKLFINSIHVF